LILFIPAYLKAGAKNVRLKAYIRPSNIKIIRQEGKGICSAGEWKCRLAQKISATYFGSYQNIGIHAYMSGIIMEKKTGGNDSVVIEFIKYFAWYIKTNWKNILRKRLSFLE
jgi:hypothetical protein